jgi:hypothetical protein
MTAITADKQGELAPTNSVHKEIVLETLATAVSADTLPVTLADFGCTKFVGISGQVHTTLDSVLIVEEPTTVVSAGVLTITVGGTAVTKKRTYRVVMR